MVAWKGISKPPMESDVGRAEEGAGEDDDAAGATTDSFFSSGLLPDERRSLSFISLLNLWISSSFSSPPVKAVLDVAGVNSSAIQEGTEPSSSSRSRRWWWLLSFLRPSWWWW